MTILERLKKHGIAGLTPLDGIELVATLERITNERDRAEDAVDRMYLSAKAPLGTGTSVPEGWKLVPVEPTFDMCRAGGFPWEEPPFPPRYRAMLASVNPPDSQSRTVTDTQRGWNEAIEAAAQLMERRNVSASEFYGREIRALKRDENAAGDSECPACLGTGQLDPHGGVVTCSACKGSGRQSRPVAGDSDGFCEDCGFLIEVGNPRLGHAKNCKRNGVGKGCDEFCPPKCERGC